MVCQQSCSGFAVAAGDANHLGIGVATGKLYFGNHRYALFHYGFHNRHVRGYSGTLHNLVGAQNLVHRMAPFLPLYALFVKNGTITRGYGTGIGKKHIHPFLLA